MVCDKLYVFPLAVFFIFPITFICSFATAVSKDHIYPFFAYISDTGTFPPEQCIFGLGLSIAMLFVICTAYIRFKQVEEFLKQKGKENLGRKPWWNKTGLFFGVIAGLGAAVVGAFQETSHLGMHLVGASMAFGGGAIFLIINGFFTKVMAPQFGSKALAYLRIFLGFACFLLYVISLSTGAKAMTYFTGDKAVKWEPHHGGWGLRVTSVVTEWVMAAFFDLYFLTLVPEFKRISLEPLQFRIVNTSTAKGRNGVNTNVVHEAIHRNSNDA